MRTYRMTIPMMYAKVREDRSLSNGDGVWTRMGYKTTLVEVEFNSIMDDAEGFAKGWCVSPASIRKSAEVTYNKCLKLVRRQK